MCTCRWNAWCQRTKSDGKSCYTRDGHRPQAILNSRSTNNCLCLQTTFNWGIQSAKIIIQILSNKVSPVKYGKLSIFLPISCFFLPSPLWGSPMVGRRWDMDMESASWQRRRRGATYLDLVFTSHNNILQLCSGASDPPSPACHIRMRRRTK